MLHGMELETQEHTLHSCSLNTLFMLAFVIIVYRDREDKKYDAACVKDYTCIMKYNTISTIRVE